MDKQTRVSVKAIISSVDGKILTIKRGPTAPSKPLKWDLPGGSLEYAEDDKNGIKREIKEETSLEVIDLKVLDVISRVDDRGDFWVTICYTAKSPSQEVKLSYEHIEYMWIEPVEFLSLDASPRNKEFVKRYKNDY